ncbi:MAG TPA: GrpB family protein [Caulobacteraceae bacterium]
MIRPLTERSAPPVRIVLSPYDPAWPKLFEAQAARIRGALGECALFVHHVGSTSVPGLAAKPVIDIILVVRDSAAEAEYAAALAGADYTLRIREPTWFEHRLLKSETPAVNLHVFSQGCPEIGRTLAFRDRLRQDEPDRRLYEATKRELAQRTWNHTQDYADAKGPVVEAILARALG